MNYRPKANLNKYKKVTEQQIKIKVIKYLETKNVILDKHHGELKGKSTLSAKLILDPKLDNTMDENKVSILISSDLSSPCNKVPAEILLEN